MAQIATPNPPEEPDTSIMTVQVIMELYEIVREAHPDWFVDDQGWESVHPTETYPQNQKEDSMTHTHIPVAPDGKVFCLSCGKALTGNNIGTIRDYDEVEEVTATEQEGSEPQPEESNDFDYTFFKSDRDEAREHADPLTFEYIKRLERIARAAIAFNSAVGGFITSASEARAWNELHDALSTVNSLDERL